jgi:gas vesicle protein
MFLKLFEEAKNKGGDFNMKKETTKRIAVISTISLAAGYVAGILTAPKSGKETRAEIKNSSAKTLRETEKHLKELYKDLGKVMEQAAVKAKSLKGHAKEKLSELIKDAKTAQKKVKELLSAIRSGDADDPELKTAVKQASEAKKHLTNYIKNTK